MKKKKKKDYSRKQIISEKTKIQTESKLYSAEDYKKKKKKDILSAASKIIISVSYLSKSDVQNFVLSSTTLLVKGVSIQIIVRKQEDEAKRKKSEPCIEMFENIGIRVIEQENISQKITIIDEKIIWYGNINFLGYTENEECCMRIVDNKIASEIESEILKP